ncbi:Intradiol ring-cleavage dioxygenase [Macrophomina phaseolina MS6]|uniref:Intradiol ring-cleavage dioxygenase n=1 Tax=Macrophomina phaseolina (strain MS6) TaxID=1126212 RepID=K2R7F0_MACPH|nr:Intradiol ring-cleavage dioxygenase [Macrophomina phaseolina MS6]
MVRLSAVAAVAAATLVAAHPGEHHDHAKVKREIVARDALASRQGGSLSKCAGSLKARALHERAVARRAATAERLRKERGINKSVKHRRDLAALQEFEQVNHNMTGVVNPSFVASSFFEANTSCILTPENTIGPYYVQGEWIRRDVTEGQAGVPLHLDLQFVDVNTCEPVPNLYIDIWAANATGVYSGIDVSNGQGGLNTTFLRGVQESDDDGVAQFDTIFPGHYEGKKLSKVWNSPADLLLRPCYPRACCRSRQRLRCRQRHHDRWHRCPYRPALLRRDSPQRRRGHLPLQHQHRDSCHQRRGHVGPVPGGQQLRPLPGVHLPQQRGHHR